MFNSLLAFDYELFSRINGLAGNLTIDALMVLASGKWTWIPLYAFLLYTIKRHFSFSQVGWIVLAVCGVIILTDQGSVEFFKETFQRLRPCHNPVLKDSVQLVTGKCGGQFGFISSHASNVFGLAAFCVLLMKEHSNAWWLMTLWAALVSFSRIYLGVHFPSDVVGGMLFGASIGGAAAVVTLQSIRNK